MNSLYRFSEVEAKLAKPQTIAQIINDVLSANNDECYIAMERHLRGVANTGSTQFDHAHAVMTLLKHDTRNGGRLHLAMDETGLTEKELWERLVRVLNNAGFQFRNGKLAGLRLESKSAEDESEAVNEAA